MSCPRCHAWTLLSWLVCHGRPISVALSQLPCPSVMFWPSCPLFLVLPVPSRHSPAVLCLLSCPGCPAQALLSQLSCPSILVLRAHSFRQFKKHALLKAHTQSPCFSYPELARAFKSKAWGWQSCQVLVVSVLAGRRIYVHTEILKNRRSTRNCVTFWPWRRGLNELLYKS